MLNDIQRHRMNNERALLAMIQQQNKQFNVLRSQLSKQTRLNTVGMMGKVDMCNSDNIDIERDDKIHYNYDAIDSSKVKQLDVQINDDVFIQSTTTSMNYSLQIEQTRHEIEVLKLQSQINELEYQLKTVRLENKFLRSEIDIDKKKLLHNNSFQMNTEYNDGLNLKGMNTAPFGDSDNGHSKTDDNFVVEPLCCPSRTAHFKTAQLCVVNDNSNNNNNKSSISGASNNNNNNKLIDGKLVHRTVDELKVYSNQRDKSSPLDPPLQLTLTATNSDFVSCYSSSDVSNTDLNNGDFTDAPLNYNSGAKMVGVEDVGRVFDKKLNDSSKFKQYGKKRGRQKNIYKWVVGNTLQLPQVKQFGTFTKFDINNNGNDNHNTMIDHAMVNDNTFTGDSICNSDSSSIFDTSIDGSDNYNCSSICSSIESKKKCCIYDEYNINYSINKDTDGVTAPAPPCNPELLPFNVKYGNAYDVLDKLDDTSGSVIKCDNINSGFQMVV